MANVFTGQILEARPLLSLYEPTSLMQIKVKGKVTFDSGAPYVVWYTGWVAYDEQGNKLGADTRSHSIAPWTKVDTATDEFILSCGKAPDNSFNMRIRLRAAPGTLPWTDSGWSFVADVYVPINVARSIVTPSPIPTTPSIPGLPSVVPPLTESPAPNVSPMTPTITPITYVTPTEVTPTPAVTPTAAAAFDWKWVLIGGVVLLAITMMPSGAKK